ncbi:TPA: hypothetical protein EYP13_03705, partial [Candidatus Micrarchaeota archaeon]|nr:hypothetical protein [Candidatus Micrarchaeota archaeon]
MSFSGTGISSVVLKSMSSRTPTLTSKLLILLSSSTPSFSVIGFYLLGRLSDLARWEVTALAQRRGERYRVISDRFVVVHSDDVPFYSRLAYTRIYGRLWFSTRKLSEFGRLVRESGLQEYILRNQPFAVRSNVSSSFNRRVGWYIDGKVDLEAPRTTVFVVRAANRYYVLAPAHEITAKAFSPRDVKNRPFHHPTSLNARDARLLVNISAVLPGELFLDPFCGAGGILIEAAMVGAEVYGMDVVDDMVLGASVNLQHYGLRGTVIRGDARRIPVRGVDAIATDLPYGRSSKVLTRDLRSLYLDAFESMYSSLKGGRRCVVV